MPGTWHTLIEKSWSLAPHSENTSEIGVDTLDHDVYIGGLRPIAPIGTHHTLLFRGLSATNAIYASGIGTGGKFNRSSGMSGGGIGG